MTDPVLAAQGAEVRASAIAAAHRDDRAKDAALRAAAQALVSAPTRCWPPTSPTSPPRARRAPRRLARPPLLDERRVAAMAEGLAPSPRFPTRSARSSRAGAAERPARRARPRPARRRGRDLREPAQRHERRGGALPQVRQRGVPPRLGVGPDDQPRGRRRAARGAGRRGAAEGLVSLVEDTSREAAVEFMQLDGVIDCLIPRGGRTSWTRCASTRRCPTSSTATGTATSTSTRRADLEMAVAIVVNAKTSRPGVCNAAETLLVHRDVAAALLRAGRRHAEVELRGDAATRALVRRARWRHRRRLRDGVLGPRPRRARRRLARRRHRARRAATPRGTPRRS